MTLRELIFTCGNIEETTPIFLYTSIDNMIKNNALVCDTWNNIPGEHLNRTIAFFRWSPVTETMTVIIK